MVVEEVYESQHGLAVLPKMMICFDDYLVFKLKCRRESEASVKAADIYLLFGGQLLNKIYYIYIYIYIYIYKHHVAFLLFGFLLLVKAVTQ